MGSPNLRIDTTKLEPLFSDTTYEYLIEKHIEYDRQRVSLWLQNVLEKNSAEWFTKTVPIPNSEGHYESNMPNDINSIIMQQVRI